MAKGARFKDYRGCIEWLTDAGIIHVCYCLNFPELPLRGPVSLIPQPISGYFPLSISVRRDFAVPLVAFTSTGTRESFVRYPDIGWGIKLTGGNIGFSDKIYTFPYFCAFLLKEYIIKEINLVLGVVIITPQGKLREIQAITHMNDSLSLFLCIPPEGIHQAGRAGQVYKFLIYSLPKIRCGRWQQYGILDYMYEFANS